MRCLRLIISLWVVGFAEQVVDADVVETGELNQDLDRNRTFACFIIGIRSLCNMQMIGQNGLRVIMIFAQVFDSANNQEKPSSALHHDITVYEMQRQS